MTRRDEKTEPQSWGVGGHPGIAADRLRTTVEDVQRSELALEQAVSLYVGAMPFLVVSVEDDAGPQSIRGSIECNAIALLSNVDRDMIDRPSVGWLGRFSGRERVRSSGLWNNNHVDEVHDNAFLDVLEAAVRSTQSAAN